MNRVKLKFDKSITALVGHEFGVKIYNEQVKGKLNLNDKFIIHFPAQIKLVSSTFVQGFFEDIVKQIGLSTTERRTKIESENKRLESSLMRRLP